MTRRGAALPLALLVLAVVGVLAAGLVWVALLEARSGLNAVRIVQARAAAETGAFRALEQVPAAVLQALGAGDSTTVGDSLGDAGSYKGVVRALGGGLFAVTVRGSGPGFSGRQIVTILAVFGDSTGLEPVADRSWVMAR